MIFFIIRVYHNVKTKFANGGILFEIFWSGLEKYKNLLSRAIKITKNMKKY